MMLADPVVGALQINGGTSSALTYIGSCNASGVYSPRTATITARSSSGAYGGFAGHNYNGPIISHSGQYPSAYNAGYVTIDGLVISGFSYKGMRIGGGSSGDGPKNIQGVTVQNCLFTGGGFNSGDAVDNIDALWVDYTVGAVIANNSFLNNMGLSSASADHLNGIICWGCQGSQIFNNTLVNAGNIYGKEVANQGNNVYQNYVDCSMYGAQSTANGIQDFTGANTSGLTQTTNIHHNILLSSAYGIGGATLSDAYGWTTPVNIYNNTIVMVQAGGAMVECAALVYSQASRNVKFYNNILTGAPSQDKNAIRVNANAPSVWDYNLFRATNMNWALLAGGNGASDIGNFAAFLLFQAAAVANGGILMDVHSIQNNTPGFTNAGTLAQLYQLASGSPALNAGRVGGVPSGAACNIGAWDGTVTQIGSSASAPPMVLPDPPANVTVS